MSKKIAIIDLGSNSVRMLLMKVFDDGSYKMLDEVKDMVRLSQGMGEENTLKPVPIKRTMNTLNLFKKLIQVHQADQVIPIATAAVRNAANQELFLDKVKMETGFDFRVASGEEEARYGYLGVINTMRVESGVMIDIGGASTEVAWFEDRQLKKAVSFPFGAVNLTEQFLGKETITPEKVKKVEQYVKKNLAELDWLKPLKGYPVVGLGGTIRTLAKMNKHKIGYPLESLHNYQMRFDEVEEHYQQLTKGTVEEIRQIPGVNKDRSDIIAAGVAPLRALLKTLDSGKLMISGNGLREGVFYEQYLKETGNNGEFVTDVTFHSVDNILKNFEMNLEHCHHVKKLALSLFDQTREIHGLGAAERRLLAVGALLHDVGMYIDYYNHHKHGFYLALNARLNGLRNRERLMCAYLVGMHRSLDLKEDWKQYDMLINEKDMEIIQKLSLFVRIAEKLDRSETGSVQDVTCYLTETDVQIMVKTTNSPELEIITAMTFSKDFKKLFGRKLYIV
ncbi:MAG: exopolyphosphatase [Bacillota bacterium]|nr:exopolyphosphatase [Bacillota bacterium]